MLATIRRWLGDTPRIASALALRDFLAALAADTAQRTVMGYCDVKAGADREALFGEPAFRAALDHCRRESTAAVLADLVVLAYRQLAPHAGGRDTVLTAALARLYGAALAAQGGPPHPADGGDDPAATVAARLEEARTAGVAGPAEVARTAAHRIRQVLPIHESHRRTDREAIEGAVRFHAVAAWDRMVRTVDAPAVAADLLREGWEIR